MLITNSVHKLARNWDIQCTKIPSYFLLHLKWFQLHWNIKSKLNISSVIKLVWGLFWGVILNPDWKQRFWPFLTVFGRFWPFLTVFDRFWQVLTGFDQIWHILTMTAFWLHFGCTLAAFWLNFDYNLAAFWRNFDRLNWMIKFLSSYSNKSVYQLIHF